MSILVSSVLVLHPWTQKIRIPFCLFPGIILCPIICLIMTIGNSAIILGLWPVHFLWTYYCFLRCFFWSLSSYIFAMPNYVIFRWLSIFEISYGRTKQFGIVLKLVLCICSTLPLLLWPLISIVGSIIGGAAFGLLSPIFATFDAVGEGKDDVFFHCLYVS